MTTNTALPIAIGVIVLGYIFYRQLIERPIKDNPLKLPAILLVIGVISTVNYLQHVSQVAVGEVVSTLLGFVVAALIAVPRGYTMHIYRNAAGVMVRRGNAVTIVLWFVAIGAHLAIAVFGPTAFGEPRGSLGGLESATILVFLGISLGVQGLVARKRVLAHGRTAHSLAV
ncbi:hypothetical protein EF294_14400 [Gordonia oryzae]|uniref:DUF1453 domain-containing protein n=1 Tax=Gordonia oryzae TaxID=2487349 RepID=A0A3N4H1D4_9ACTN|nr:hypothetical protein [Gordonia oryzae]RPA59014.1 hypothetical protein EF294_14400 [Gordonia oryzae]